MSTRSFIAVVLCMLIRLFVYGSFSCPIVLISLVHIPSNKYCFYYSNMAHAFPIDVAVTSGSGGPTPDDDDYNDWKANAYDL